MWFLAEFHVFFFLSHLCFAYKPILIIHGILSGNETMIKLANIIKQYHPGTRIYISSRFDKWNSLEPLAHQVAIVGADVLQISALHPEGFHLIGYSQGGLLSRAVLEYFPMHRVHNFISLSSPQAGQYGTNMLHIFFPNLAKEEAYKIFYSKYGQYLSVANFWNDPHHEDLYFKYCKFLPSINNEISQPLNMSQYFKHGITKLKKMVLIGGPDDGTIEPWQSSHFSYYDEKENVVSVKERRIYQEDLFGLRTLDERGALYMYSVNGVKHHYWYRNKTVIKHNILPWLS